MYLMKLAEAGSLGIDCSFFHSFNRLPSTSVSERVLATLPTLRYTNDRECHKCVWQCNN